MSVIRIGRRTGLWAMMTAATIPVGFSLVGMPYTTVVAACVLAMPLVLAGALAWVERDRQNATYAPRCLRHKRTVVLVTLASLLLVATTEWPLRVGLALEASEIAQVRSEVLRDYQRGPAFAKAPLFITLYLGVLTSPHSIAVNRHVGFLAVRKAEIIPSHYITAGPGLRLYLRGGRVLFQHSQELGGQWNLDAVVP